MGSGHSRLSRKKKHAFKSAITYVSPDPDFGWKVLSKLSTYSSKGWSVTFHNQQNSNTLEDINLIGLAINIAVRSTMLANKYGIIARDAGNSNSNLLELLAKDSNKTSGCELNRVIGVPHYNWELVSRSVSSQSFAKQYPELFLDDGEEREVNPYLQLMTDYNKKEVLIDVAEVAINLAEQLYRLEKNDTEQSHRIPTNMFGWKIMDNQHFRGNGADNGINNLYVAVANAQSEAYLFLPEVLIMDVASWIQETYLTTPIF